MSFVTRRLVADVGERGRGSLQETLKLSIQYVARQSLFDEIYCGFLPELLSIEKPCL